VRFIARCVDIEIEQDRYCCPSLVTMPAVALSRRSGKRLVDNGEAIEVAQR